MKKMIDGKNKKDRLFIVESFSPVRFPKKYLSKYGQLLEHSPYCERDIQTAGFFRRNL